MIGIETYLGIIGVLIVLFIVGLFAVYKDNVLGFVLGGFSTIVTIALTVLAGFGRVGNVTSNVLYTQLTDGSGTSAVQNTTTLIDASLVYISGFIALMMVIVLIFIIGRYIAVLATQRGEEEE